MIQILKYSKGGESAGVAAERAYKIIISHFIRMTFQLQTILPYCSSSQSLDLLSGNSKEPRKVLLILGVVGCLIHQGHLLMFQILYHERMTQTLCNILKVLTLYLLVNDTEKPIS